MSDKKEIIANEDLEFAPPIGAVKKGDKVTLSTREADFEIAAGRATEVKPKATNA